MFEHHRQALLPRRAFLLRVLKNAAGAAGLVFAALGIGVLGYHQFARFSWIDSLLNASMILGGMGPVGDLPNNAAKLFASAYALFSGLMFITVAGLVFAPVIHRFLHRFHLESEEDKPHLRKDRHAR